MGVIVVLSLEYLSIFTGKLNETHNWMLTQTLTIIEHDDIKISANWC